MLFRRAIQLSVRSEHWAEVTPRRVSGRGNERARGSTMSAREIRDQKAIAQDMFVQQAGYENAVVSASPLQAVTRVETANLIRILRQLEFIAKRRAARIAFKTKGRILFLNWPRSLQCKPTVITFRCDIDPIPICCASPSLPWRRSSSHTVLFASTDRSS